MASEKCGVFRRSSKMAFQRAGADGILTYLAVDMARRMAGT